MESEKPQLSGLTSLSDNDVIFTQDQPSSSMSVAKKNNHYPNKIRLISICIGLCLAVFLVALDNTIIATAIPKITDEFGALDAVGWYASAYLLTTCAFQLMFGTLYKLFPVKYVFLVAIVLFEIGSAVCGTAPNSASLIIGRAIAGLGSAGVFSGSLVIIALSVSLDQRPTYNGLLMSMFGIASVVGPLLGGAFTDHVTWRWCFYVNLPIGAVTIIIIVFFLKLEKEESPDHSLRIKGTLLSRLDPLGTLVFIPGITCLLLALQWGGLKYDWSNSRIVALLVIFGVCMFAFCSIQVWKGEGATIPPRIFKNRSMIFGPLFAFLLGGSYFIMVYFIPIWFQAIKQVSAMKSGIMCIPMILAVVIFSLLSGLIITLWGHYVPLFYISAICSAVGAGLLTTFQVGTGSPQWIGYQVLYGTGIGIGFQLAVIACQVVLDTADLPLGMALIVFFQSLGGAIFTSVGESVFINGLVNGLHDIAPTLDAARLSNTGVTGLATIVPPNMLPRVQEAYNSSLTNTWFVSVALSSLSIIGALGMEYKRIRQGAAFSAAHV